MQMEAIPPVPLALCLSPRAGPHHHYPSGATSAVGSSPRGLHYPPPSYTSPGSSPWGHFHPPPSATSSAVGFSPRGYLLHAPPSCASAGSSPSRHTRSHSHSQSHSHSHSHSQSTLVGPSHRASLPPPPFTHSTGSGSSPRRLPASPHASISAVGSNHRAPLTPPPPVVIPGADSSPRAVASPPQASALASASAAWPAKEFREGRDGRGAGGEGRTLRNVPARHAFPDMAGFGELNAGRPARLTQPSATPSTPSSAPRPHPGHGSSPAHPCAHPPPRPGVHSPSRSHSRPHSPAHAASHAPPAQPHAESPTRPPLPVGGRLRTCHGAAGVVRVRTRRTAGTEAVRDSASGAPTAQEGGMGIAGGQSNPLASAEPNWLTAGYDPRRDREGGSQGEAADLEAPSIAPHDMAAASNGTEAGETGQSGEGRRGTGGAEGKGQGVGQGRRGEVEKGAGKGSESSTYRFILPDGKLCEVVAESLTAEQVLQQSPGHFLSLSARRPLKLPPDTKLFRWNTYYVHKDKGRGATSLDLHHERKSIRALHRKQALSWASLPRKSADSSNSSLSSMGFGSSRDSSSSSSGVGGSGRRSFAGLQRPGRRSEGQGLMQEEGKGRDTGGSWLGTSFGGASPRTPSLGRKDDCTPNPAAASNRRSIDLGGLPGTGRGAAAARKEDCGPKRRSLDLSGAAFWGRPLAGRPLHRLSADFKGALGIRGQARGRGQGQPGKGENQTGGDESPAGSWKEWTGPGADGVAGGSCAEEKGERGEGREGGAWGKSERSGGERGAGASRAESGKAQATFAELCAFMKKAAKRSKGNNGACSSEILGSCRDGQRSERLLRDIIDNPARAAMTSRLLFREQRSPKHTKTHTNLEPGAYPEDGHPKRLFIPSRFRTTEVPPTS